MFSTMSLQVQKRAASKGSEISIHEAVMKHLKEAAKIVNKFSIYLGAHIVTPCLQRINGARAHRSTTPKSSGSNSSSSDGNDPDPEPASLPIYYSCFTFITSLFIFTLSLCQSFVATSACEVTK